MATESLTNPFADFGKIVYGDRFVGRNYELKKISQRIEGDAFGNLAIMGLPRIGKSSLAWQGIMLKKETFLEKKTIPIYFQVGSCKDHFSFFKQMVSLLLDELEFVCNDPKLSKVVSVATQIKETTEETEFYLLINKFYKFVKLLGFKTIYVLDEFDSVQTFFDVSNFQTLRELSISPETKLCLVTCSRKTIQEIEAINGAISNFYGTFSEIRLGMFDEDSMSQYWQRVEPFLSLSEKYKKDIEFYVGRHPFLLDFLNDYCFNNNISNDIDKIDLNEIRLELLHHLNTIEDTLNHENLLNKAIQLVVGPVYDVTKIQEEKLLKYQFLRIIDNQEKLNILGRLMGSSFQGKSYVLFSDYFTNIFEQQYIQGIDYWPLWSETEKIIRNLIKVYVEEIFGPNWEVDIEAKFGSSQNWLSPYNELKETRKRTLNLFPSASENLIDYTLTKDMYNLFISPAWKDWFSEVFGEDKKTWSSRFVFLAQIRNPVAHNNKEFISNEQISQASEYCKLIKKAIKEWGATRVV